MPPGNNKYTSLPRILLCRIMRFARCVSLYPAPPLTLPLSLPPPLCPAVQTLLDPYAKYVKGRAVFGQRDEFEQFKGIEGSVFRGTFDFESAPFDWGSDYKKPNLPLKDLIIAELPVRLFTGVAGGLPVPGNVVGRAAQGWGGQGCAAAVCTKGLRNVSRGVRPAVTAPYACVCARSACLPHCCFMSDSAKRAACHACPLPLCSL